LRVGDGERGPSRRRGPASGAPPRARAGRRPRLSSAELALLRAACGRRAVGPALSLFGPASVTWRVDREAATLLGGGRALLLQVAHPLVAAGVAAHSRFGTAPLERLRRTLDLTLTIAFADAARAIRAVREIEQAHARVRGVLEQAVGPFPRGTPYDASDPALLLWVHATLVDSALAAHERFVGPLAPRDRAVYYEESKVAARLFRIPEALIPPTWRAFRAYMTHMLRGDTLTVGPAGRALARAILRPPLPPGVRHLFQATNLATVGLLPPVLRARFGLAWSPACEAALAAVAATLRRVLPLLPEAVRFLPHARRAMAVAGEAAGGRRAGR
jgi:uncharacterized protein (DUF2236 family)